MKHGILFPAIFLMILGACLGGKAQERDHELVQFTGITITADSLNAVPYTRITVKTTREGTLSAIPFFSTHWAINPYLSSFPTPSAITDTP
jgi:hypothetical protein